MNMEKKFIIQHLTEKEIDNPRIKVGIRCWHVIHTDRGGYAEGERDFLRYDDGTICIGDENGGVFLRGEQLELFRKFLNSEV